MDPILDRVRKLLALATSPNVHEAASAAARAQSLIEKHRLEGLLLGQPEADLLTGGPITDGAEAPLERTRKLRKWRIVLAQAIAEHAGCVAYSAETPQGQELRLVGRAADRESARVLWDWLVEQIQWLSATEGAGRSRAWHEAFRIGAVESIAERLAQARAGVRETLPQEALVWVDPVVAARARAVEDYVQSELKLGKGRAIRVDVRAWERGREAAGAVVLPSGGRRLG